MGLLYRGEKEDFDWLGGILVLERFCQLGPNATDGFPRTDEANQTHRGAGRIKSIYKRVRGATNETNPSMYGAARAPPKSINTMPRQGKGSRNQKRTQDSTKDPKRVLLPQNRNKNQHDPERRIAQIPSIPRCTDRPLRVTHTQETQCPSLSVRSRYVTHNTECLAGPPTDVHTHTHTRQQPSLLQHIGRFAPSRPAPPPMTVLTDTVRSVDSAYTRRDTEQQQQQQKTKHVPPRSVGGGGGGGRRGGRVIGSTHLTTSDATNLLSLLTHNAKHSHGILHIVHTLHHLVHLRCPSVRR